MIDLLDFLWFKGSVKAIPAKRSKANAIEKSSRALTVASLDLIGRDLTYFLSVVYSKSPSVSFKQALEFSKTADRFEVIKIKGTKKDFYFVGFNNNPGSLAKAEFLLKLCSAWNSTSTFINGKSTTPWMIKAMLSCYIEGVKAGDRKAHCYTSAHVSDTDLKIIISCKWAINHAVFAPAHPELKKYFLPEHVVGFEKQLYASAVQMGCEQCPLFKCEVIIPPIPLDHSKDKTYWKK